MKPQLLAPAGNLEKLKWAARYGADAVYFGTKFGSLRSFAGNLTFDQAEEGLEFLHSRGKLGYVTLNIYPFSDEYPKIIDTAKTLDSLGADAFIVSDPAVLYQLKKLNLNAALHVSTQANVTSYQSALVYGELGASRVNLARELSLDQIKHIQNQLAGKVETEVFIHGSVCFSFSGRCAISDYLTGYRANRGECKHPCRWKYALVEETRPGEYMPVAEDDRGAYLFNSKELALFSFLPQLIEAGITSFKIEGRMKSIHYIAAVVSFYRQLLDGRAVNEQDALEILNRVPNRGYSCGFIKGSITPEDYRFDKSTSEGDSIFVGNVTDEKINSQPVLEVRNKIHAGETLELLTPDGCLSKTTLDDPLITTGDQQVDFANNSQFILLSQNLPPYSILRRVQKDG